MIKLKVDVDTSAIKLRAREVQKHIAEQAEVITKETAEAILEIAKTRCPVDTGELRDSGYIEKTEDGYTVGFSADYAIFAHEQPQSMRKNGESRFLASAVEDVVGLHGDNLKAIIKERVADR